jgi:hypothetical protein
MELRLNESREILATVTKSIEQAAFEKLIVAQLVKKFSAFSWNPKIHYRIHTIRYRSLS